MASERHGIPVGWTIAGANHHDIPMLEPTLNAIRQTGLLTDIETIHLDRGYDYPKVRRLLTTIGLNDIIIQRRGAARPGEAKRPIRLGLRWIVESTNSWLSNYGQLRRRTDRRIIHRHHPHHRKAHHLPKPMGPPMTPIR